MAGAALQELPGLLLIRPEPASRRFLAQLSATQERPLAAEISPLLAIEPLPVTLPDLPWSGLVFTSENGVAQAGRFGLPRGLVAWCVGAQTMQAALDAGFLATSADGDAKALIRLILESGTPGPLLHIRGEHSIGDVAKNLSHQGCPCHEIAAYAQSVLPLSDNARVLLAGARPVVIPMFSARSASLLLPYMPAAAPLHVVAISKAVAAAAQGMGARTVTTAAAANAAGVIAATREAMGLIA
jgi:uroporphyrinogen-III synthase